MKEKKIILSNGRKLSYAEYGTADGYPILYCHGSQSSRFEMHYDISFAVKNNLRIITFDRPGHGLSDFDGNASIQSVASDVSEIIQKEKIQKYSVVGMSAGAPFAMGIALYNQEQISQLKIVSGFAPYTTESKKALSKEVRILLQLAKSFPFLLRLMLKIQNSQLKKNPAKALKNFLKVMSAPDQEVLKNTAVMGVIEKMFTEAFRKGHQGVAHEISNILVQDWNMNLNEIEVPTTIYQGDKDANVPLDWAKLLHKEIPNSELKIYPNEGHLIIFKHVTEIFKSLT